MSQAKVDRYKEEKRNRQQIMKKEKRQWMLTRMVKREQLYTLGGNVT